MGTLWRWVANKMRKGSYELSPAYLSNQWQAASIEVPFTLKNHPSMALSQLMLVRFRWFFN